MRFPKGQCPDPSNRDRGGRAEQMPLFRRASRPLPRPNNALARHATPHVPHCETVARLLVQNARRRKNTCPGLDHALFLQRARHAIQGFAHQLIWLHHSFCDRSNRRGAAGFPSRAGLPEFLPLSIDESRPFRAVGRRGPWISTVKDRQYNGAPRRPRSRRSGGTCRRE
jgi:hypothetical protein